MATAYEDILKNLGPVTTRTADQEDLYNYALGKVSTLQTGVSDPYVQSLLAAYQPQTATVPTAASIESGVNASLAASNLPTQTQQTQPVSPVSQQPAAAPAAPAPAAPTPTPGQPTVQQTTQYDQSLQQQLTDLENYPDFQANPEYQALITNLLRNLNPEFTYSAENDPALIQAQQEVDRLIRENMAKRGALYSDTTASLVIQEIGKLIPQFRQQAQSEFQQTFSNKLNLVNTIEGLINDDYMRYTDKYTRQYNFLQVTANLRETELQQFQNEWENQYKLREEARQKELDQLNLKQRSFENAMARVNMLGYVDNESSVTLGLPVGTQTYEAKQAAIKRQQEIEDREREIEVQKQRDAEERAWQLQYLKAQEESQKRIISYSAKYKSSGGGGGSYGGSSKDLKSFIKSAGYKDLQNITDALVFNSDDWINSIGESAYNSVVSTARDEYTDTVKANWKNKGYGEIMSLLTSGDKSASNGQSYNAQDYYINMMGDDNYNAYYQENWSKYVKKGRESNPYFGR